MWFSVLIFFSPVPGLKVSSAWTADGEGWGGRKKSDNLFKVPVIKKESPAEMVFLFHNQIQILTNIHAHQC